MPMLKKWKRLTVDRASCDLGIDLSTESARSSGMSPARHNPAKSSRIAPLRLLPMWSDQLSVVAVECE